jgi:hypothetical protein
MVFCPTPPTRSRNNEIALGDLYAVPHLEKYIWAPGGASCLWSRRYVNSIMPKIDTGRRLNGKPVMIDAATWLDTHRAVKQITWAPGEAEIIEDRLIFAGGWKPHAGVHVLNIFQPPPPITGDLTKANRWIDHVRLLYPNEADEIIDWFAHRFQNHGVKINFALVLSGPMGIGKDWIIEVLRIGLGADNFQTAKPAELTKDNNSFVKTLVLHIDETHNLGEAGKLNRFTLYETIKPLAAAPPATLPTADKWIKRHYIPNVLDLLITTNHHTDGIFLDPDDRRHLVCWSDVTKELFAERRDFWTDMYDWMRRGGGAQHVAAFLMQRNLSKFNPGAPPRQTAAFFEIVQASLPPEDAALADALDELAGYDEHGEPRRDEQGKVARPDIVTLEMVRGTTCGAGLDWLDSKPAAFSHRMQREGFVAVRNPQGNRGQWFYDKRRRVLYGKADMGEAQRQQAAWRFMQRRPTTTAQPSK